jgi:hypothetical protein
MLISWDEAVEEGKRLIKDLETNQMRIGEIADRLEPKYGESTLARYAQIMETNVNTLQNYRSVYRTWHEDPKVKSFPKFSVAKALVKHPERAKIVEERPDITEREAKEETKKLKGEQARYEQYTKQAMHVLTKRIVTRLNAFLDEKSGINQMLDDVNILNTLDMEYVDKIIFALNRANERVVGALKRLNVKIDTYQKPPEASMDESTKDEPSERVSPEEPMDDVATDLEKIESDA